MDTTEVVDLLCDASSVY